MTAIVNDTALQDRLQRLETLTARAQMQVIGICGCVESPEIRERLEQLRDSLISRCGFGNLAELSSLDVTDAIKAIRVCVQHGLDTSELASQHLQERLCEILDPLKKAIDSP